MSLNLSESLLSLAQAQALLVAPELGEGYAGKSAGAVAALLMLLANGLEERLARRAALSKRLEALLQSVPTTPDLRARAAAALAHVDGQTADQRMDRMMEMLGDLLEWAEQAGTGDPTIAAGLLDFLCDWADSERLDLSALPG